MDLEAVAVVCFVVFVVVLWWHLWPRPPEEELPPELCGTRLVYAERLFCSLGPVSITAKVDRVYRNAKEALILVGLKTRKANRAYRSDVIELSAQRLALMGQTGEAVADHAYVLTERPDGRRTGCHRVRLMEPVDLIALVERREKLLAGKAEPRPTCAPGMCQKCAFARLCDPPWR
ncbi:MAG: PD-(D/E)XK nuclease family protein [Burkholderiaceae bacterium]|jgi:CRISPR-associated exonuclease Cas4|uniref:PD-(D/E)XK nuclease family protein n=1 Tax=Polaromonas sp. TaxID=1869339 RepID=UPI0024885B08|nr:PD-(D/E)XK nuclease family protein [Polaromonas sp.]MDI1339515.1 PD-(D/E)XK nuclease family protein [Polaromonas sp.]MDO8774058.1 PD-(D/E)XK nuclease family protein [Burkholderiaceae bacterium]